MRFPRNVIVLPTLAVLAAQDADRAVIGLMHGPQVRIIHRASVDSEFDLVVAAAPSWPDPRNGFYWGPRTDMGLFLQPRTDPNRVYRIAMQSGPGEDGCYARLERVSTSGIVLSCTPDKGFIGPLRKFVYDIRAKALVKHIDFQPFLMHRVFPAGAKAVLVGTDSARLLAVQFDASREEPFRILAGADADRYTRRLKSTTYTIGTGAAARPYIAIQPEQPSPVAFGPGNRFVLMAADHSAYGSIHPKVVEERVGATSRKYSLPQSSYEAFASARPAQAGPGRAFTQIEEYFGPSQLSGGTLWLAKTFYDGEGFTGVGGFGYFDPDSRRYVLFSPPEVRDWSASAMLVEPEAVWLGLVRHGEWRSFGGGLLRFDRASQTATVTPLPEVIGDIARIGDRLVMATEFGLAVYHGSTLRRFFVDQTTAGQLRVAEALPAKAQ